MRLFPILALWLWACDSGTPRGMQPVAARVSTASANANSGNSNGANSKTAPVAAPSPSATQPSVANAAPPKAGDIEWHDSLDWHSYQQGIAIARASHKPILLMVYANWCSKCRALVPVFERSDVRELVNKMVAVRQDQDEPAPWLSDIAAGDNYVPRIMFLNADGVPMRQVTSGHPRYPFFYVADKPDILLGSLKRALSI